MMVRTTHAIGWVLAGALATSGCFGAQAKTVPEIPPLDMPVAPPRRVVSNQPVTLPPAEMPGDPVRDQPSQLAPPPTTRADTPRAAEPPKPPSVEPPKAADDSAKVPIPPSTLQTTPTQREVEVERRVRVQLTQATSDLSRINYQALNADARTQYDTAKRFVAQSEDALRAKNLVFANNLAEKAAALAAQLVIRR